MLSEMAQSRAVFALARQSLSSATENVKLRVSVRWACPFRFAPAATAKLCETAEMAVPGAPVVEAHRPHVRIGIVERLHHRRARCERRLIEDLQGEVGLRGPVLEPANFASISGSQRPSSSTNASDNSHFVLSTISETGMPPVASSRAGNIVHAARAKVQANPPAISDFRTIVAPDAHETASRNRAILSRQLARVQRDDS